MTEIRIYVEGGGDHADQKAELRKSFNGLLRTMKSKAEQKHISWNLVPSGGRQKTYEAFMNALRNHPDAINVLLVDAEAPVATLTGDFRQDARVHVNHLTERDGWDLSAVAPERIHLMVQCMEAWIVADVKTLGAFYGRGFLGNALPKRPNLEEEPKTELFGKLKRATQATQKREFHKIWHVRQIWERIDPEIVASRCPRFGLLTRWLEDVITAA